MSSGWIKLHRAMRDNPLLQDATRRGFWVTLLMMAAHKPVRTMVGDQVIELQPGQFTTTRNRLAKETGLSPDQAYRLMQKLSQHEMLTHEGLHNRCTLVTIVNWGIYQSREDEGAQPPHNHRATDDEISHNHRATESQALSALQGSSDHPAHNHRATDLEKPRTKQEVKKYKNERSNTYDQEFERFWTVYPRKIAKPRAYDLWKNWIRDGYAPDDLVNAAGHYRLACTDRDPAFIKHASTFLSRKGKDWLDWIDGVPEGEMPSKQLQLVKRDPLRERRL